MGVQLQSHLLVVFKCYGTSSYQNWVVLEMIYRPHGPSKLMQLPTARASMEVIQEMFLEHVTLSHGEIPWPALSPDLCLFLWGYSKLKCALLHYTTPRTIMTSRSKVRSKLQWYQKTWRGEHWETCEQGSKCVRNDGQHLSDALFKTKEAET
jgi:hypothetical protein